VADAVDTYGNTFKDGSAVLLARVVDENADLILQAGISAAEYTIYLLDDQDPDTRTAVTGHTGGALVVADIIFDTLQTGAEWTIDGTGYNLSVTVDVSADEAFAIAGRRYLVVVTLIPTSGQPILVRFRCNVI
jgi:hypothetical protein